MEGFCRQIVMDLDLQLVNYSKDTLSKEEIFC